MKTQIHLNSKGIGLVEALITVGIVGISFLALISLQSPLIKAGNQIASNNALEQLQWNTSGILQNSNAWLNTISANSAMTCIRTNSCSAPGLTGRLTLIDAGNNSVFPQGRMAPGLYGFERNGTPCNSYSPQGNDACPIEMALVWTLTCIAPCKQPYQINVTATFNYAFSSGEKTFPINMQKYNLAIVEQYP